MWPHYVLWLTPQFILSTSLSVELLLERLNYQMLFLGDIYFFFFATWVMAEWYAKPIKKKSNCSYLTPGGEHHESTTGECYKASVTLRGFYCMSRISKTKNPAQGLISLNNALIFLIHLLLIAHKESGWLYFLICNWTFCFPTGGRRFPRCAGEAVRWLC